MKKQIFKIFSIGLLSFFAHAPFHLFFFIPLIYGLLFIILEKNADNSKKAFLLGQSFGFGYFFGGLYWVGNALLVDPSEFLIFTPLAYLGLPFGLALFYGISAYISFKIIKWINKKEIIYSFIILFTVLSLMDVLRGFIFTGFPWNLPIYSLGISDILIQPVYYLGAYLYNSLFILWALSFGLYPFIKKKLLIIIHIIPFVLITAIGEYRLSNQNLKQLEDNKIYRIIQPNIPQEIRWDEGYKRRNFEILKNLTTQNVDPKKEYVFIWPETSLHYHPEYDHKIASEIKTILNGKHHLITGKLRFEYSNQGYDIYNSVFSISPEGGIKSQYDKVHLVPFGEYLPLIPLLKTLGLRHISHFENSFKFGKEQTVFEIGNNTKIGTLICYEAIFPKYARKLKKMGADLIINITNDAWFGNSTGPYQHLTQTRFRAVENKIHILRSANTGISALITPYGKIKNNISLNKSKYSDIII